MTNSMTRRHLLTGAVGLAGATAVSGCIGSDGGGGETSAPPASKDVVLQSNMQDAGPKAALAAVTGKDKDHSITVNTVATSQFRAQLPTYLTSNQAPDVLTWYAGSVTNGFAKEGLLYDVSDLWTGDGACAKFSTALKDLSTFEGKQYFVPTNYYWWGLFFRKPSFQKWGVKEVSTWDEFLGMCDNLKTKGVAPLTTGLSNAAWMASAWFDQLNLRVNGADFHRELLAGKHSFDGDEVRAVMKRYAEILPYFHKDIRSFDAQQAAAPMARDQAAMYLVGTFATAYFPEAQQADLDFFSVPTIDAKIPKAEEAPTDGFMVPAKARNPEGGKQVANYLATAAAQKEFIEKAVSPNLPTSPDVDTSSFSPLIQKGLKLLNETEQITQFFNRDSNDQLQGTADTALTKFIDNPKDVDKILAEWQTAAKQAFQK